MRSPPPDAASPARRLAQLATQFGATHTVKADKDNIIVNGIGGPQEVDLEISGGGLTFGGGLQYYVVPALALGANVRWTVGEFKTVKFNNVSVDGFEIDATTTRINIGLTWRPMFRKR